MIVRSDKEVSLLVVEYGWLVEHLAGEFYARCRFGIDRDDIVSFGLTGLLSAARAWDPNGGANFPTYATLAIRRAICNGLAREWKPERLSRTVSLDEPAAPGGEEEDGWSRLEQIPADQDVEREVMLSVTTQAVRKAMSQLLPEQQWLINRLYLQDGASLADLAAEEAVTRQAIYHRRENALNRLRHALRAWE